MLGETVLCVALDRDHLPGRADVLTPATAMAPRSPPGSERPATPWPSGRSLRYAADTHVLPASLAPVLRVRYACWNAIKKADRARHQTRFCSPHL